MLLSRCLDDQKYEDIVKEAVGRLPWLCPGWTDYNAHDPGITLIELMAWYKEMLQYEMNQLTPSIMRGLLKLAGVEPSKPGPAVCGLEIPDSKKVRPALSRLANRQNVCFELLEPVGPQSLFLRYAVIESGGIVTDAAGLLLGRLELQPFRFGGRDGSVLRLGFTGKPDSELRLWFKVVPPEGAERREFDKGQPSPREIEFSFDTGETVMPISDGTHMLSQSGYVCLPVPERWDADPEGVYWLRLSLTRKGCEEQPRLKCVSCRRYQAVQRRTHARSRLFTLEARAGQSVSLADALSLEAELAVFLRTADGWEQLERYGDLTEGNVRSLTVDAVHAADDGKGNLLVACLDPVRVHDMLFDTTGRPGEELYLDLDGQTVLPGFRLMCSTLERDGTVRPAIWERVDELYSCGPRDRVFVYDPERETVSFGNGQYGAVPVRGKGSVMVIDLAVSLCGGGNVPANAGLCFPDDDVPVPNTAAEGGRGAETLSEAGDRLRQQLQTTEKCLSAFDYERQARRTPGLRVAAAKALPDYAPNMPVGIRAEALVTVVVLPDSGTKRPMPDKRFIDAVSRQLNRYRMIGIRVEVIGPRYIEIDVSAQVRAGPGFESAAAVRELDEWFSAKRAAFGAAVLRSDVAGILQHLPGVTGVERIEVRTADAGAYLTQAGDVLIPGEALAVLRYAEIEITRA